MNCPWNWLKQSPPGFCEETLCAWVREPANTWSNVAYLIVGLIVFVGSGKCNRPLLRMIGVASAVTGIGSTFYHASGSVGGGLFDYGGMFLGTGVLTGLNMRRWRNWGIPATYATIVAVSTLLVAAVLAFPGDERLIYMLTGPCCVIEFFLFIKRRHEIIYKNYLWAWGLVGVASLFWWLDVSKRLCDPQNHFFNGHAAWHILTAISYYLIFRFYAQFRIFEGRGSMANCYSSERIPF